MKESITDIGKTSLMHKDAAYINLPAPWVPIIPELIIEPLREGIIIPKYAGEGDAGMDLVAPEEVIIKPESTVLVKLGFAMQIPVHPFHDWGYRWQAEIRPRSGVSLKTDLIIPNSPGTIDSTYKDELGVIVRNPNRLQIDPSRPFDVDTDTWILNLKGLPEGTKEEYPEGTYRIRKGERFAQMVFNQVIRPLEIKIGKVDRSNDRGGGFGHSGIGEVESE